HRQRGRAGDLRRLPDHQARHADLSVRRAATRPAGTGGARAATALFAALLAACGSGGETLPEPPAQAQPLALTLLHINDHHSSLEGRSRTLRLRNAAGERVPVEVEVGGL